MAGWRTALWLIVVVATIGFLYLVRGILAPFILAWLIAVLLDPIVRKLSEKRIPRPVTVFGLTTLFFGLLIGLGFLVGPVIARQANQVRTDVQSLVKDLAEEAATDNVFVHWNPAILARPPGPMGNVDSFLQSNKTLLNRMGLPASRRLLQAEFINPQRDQLGKMIREGFNRGVAFVSAAVPQVILLSFTPIFVVFLLMDLDKFRSGFRKWIPPNFRRGIIDIFEEVGDVFKSYIRGLLLNISLYACVMAVALTVVGVPYSILIAMIAGILYIIPNLGGIMSLILIYLVTGFSGTDSNWFIQMPNSWLFALIPAVVFFVITTTWDMLLTPRIVGKSVKLNPFVAMFVVFCGGALFGLPGMMIAYPVAGVTKLLLERIQAITHKQTKRRLALPTVPLRHRQEG